MNFKFAIRSAIALTS